MSEETIASISYNESDNKLILESENIEFSGNLIIPDTSNNDISFNKNVDINTLSFFNNVLIQKGNTLFGKDEIEDIRNPLVAEYPIPYLCQSGFSEKEMMSNYVMDFGEIVHLNHDGTRLLVNAKDWKRLHDLNGQQNHYSYSTYNKTFGNIFTYSYNNGIWTRDTSDIHIDNSFIMTTDSNFGSFTTIDSCFNYLVGSNNNVAQVVFKYDQNNWIPFYGMYGRSDTNVNIGGNTGSSAVSNNGIFIAYDRKFYNTDGIYHNNGTKDRYVYIGGHVYLKNINLRKNDTYGLSNTYVNNNANTTNETIKYLDYNGNKKDILFGEDSFTIRNHTTNTLINNIYTRTTPEIGNVKISANGSRVVFSVDITIEDHTNGNGQPYGALITADIVEDSQENSGYIAQNLKVIIHAENYNNIIDTSSNIDIKTAFAATYLPRYFRLYSTILLSYDGNRIFSLTKHGNINVFLVHDYSYNIDNWVLNSYLRFDKNVVPATGFAISNNGNRIAIGFHGNSNNAYYAGDDTNTGDVPKVEIYDYNSIDNSWNQSFPTIYFESHTNLSSVSLSENGKTLAVGLPNNPAPGCVKVYELVEKKEVKLQNIIFTSIDNYVDTNVQNNYIDISNYYFD